MTPENVLTVCISVQGDVLSYVLLEFPENHYEKGLIDTGACANAISVKNYEDLKSSARNTAILLHLSEFSEAKLVSGELLHVRG